MLDHEIEAYYRQMDADWADYQQERGRPVDAPICVAWLYRRGDTLIHPDLEYADGITHHEAVGCCPDKRY